MHRIIILLSLLLFCRSVSALDLDITEACKEKKEQQNAMFGKMSTSYSEAFLSGQCIGFEKINVRYSRYEIIYLDSFEDLPKACSEFVEKKEALVPFLSTSLSEATLAGMCVGAIYKVSTICNKAYGVRYLDIAKGIVDLSAEDAVNRIGYHLGCNEYQYGQ
ncbi:hypothetical protein [Shewanella ulleungensis]|uniref:hypothetical protein n=1 Tax=Shewanella ulleungensis TaxID=2282699 RepID=UPI003D7A1E7E